YRSYVDILKKKVIGTEDNDEKEKDECSESAFPEGSRVYTSEAGCGMLDSFIVVNRKSDYLKRSTLAYLKEQKLEPIVDHLRQEELHNYHQQMLHRPRKKVRMRTRRRMHAQNNWTPRRLRNRMHIGLFDWPIE